MFFFLFFPGKLVQGKKKVLQESKTMGLDNSNRRFPGTKGDGSGILYILEKEKMELPFHDCND